MEAGAMSETFWYPEDKQWMKQRKEAWKSVKHSLDVISHYYSPFKRKYHKYHKELFLTGMVNDEAKNIFQGVEYSNGNEVFEYNLPLFEVWYHPEPEQLDYKAMVISIIKRTSIHRLRESLFVNYFRMSCDKSQIMLSSAEGMMNGREAEVVKLVCPGFDYLTPVHEELEYRPDWSQCYSPGKIEHNLKFGTRLELTGDARFIPYAPGQYLWDHFSYAIEHYPELVFNPKSSNYTYDEHKRFLLEIIAQILGFEKRRDKSRKRPSTIAMVEQLIEKYESKSFSDPLLKLWDDAKQNIDDFIDTSNTYLFLDSEELVKYNHMPVDFQNERISQWKQV